MITYKTPEDFKKMEAAGKVVSNIHYEIYDKTKAGMTLIDLDDIAKNIIEKSNVKASFLGYHDYPAHICASPNDVIVHGIPNDYIVNEGDIISIDVGVKNLLSKTKHALHEGIKLVKDGQKLGTIGHKIDKIAKKNNFGNVRNYVGHGIGQEMHEEPQVPHYGKKNQGFELKTGMAICIEPMFNLGTEENFIDEDGWTIRTLDGKKSAHWEHTIGITEEGTRVFTENKSH